MRGWISRESWSRVTTSFSVNIKHFFLFWERIRVGFTLISISSINMMRVLRQQEKERGFTQGKLRWRSEVDEEAKVRIMKVYRQALQIESEILTTRRTDQHCWDAWVQSTRCPLCRAAWGSHASHRIVPRSPLKWDIKGSLGEIMMEKYTIN